MKDIIIFGVGDFADILKVYIEEYLPCKVIAFTVNREFINDEHHTGLPVVAFEDIESRFKSNNYSMVIGMIGKQMFMQRKEIFTQCKNKNYELPNIICTETLSATSKMGEGNIILPNVSIGPFVEIGTGNIFWQNCVIPHHNNIGNFNHFAPSVSLSGNSKIKNHCFLGNNVTVNNHTTIMNYTFVGAGAYVRKDTKSYQVIVPNNSFVLEGKRSTDFM